MAVMDAIDKDYEEFTIARKHHSTVDEIRDRLITLHQANFVHGDVRDTNVMVRKNGPGIQLVDFDWAGEIGKVRYPANVNRTDIVRPEGALDGRFILAEHDMFMLNHLRNYI
jgi:tRNA A-37 threonylcarbamoyl transferase component Bud32